MSSVFSITSLATTMNSQISPWKKSEEILVSVFCNILTWINLHNKNGAWNICETKTPACVQLNLPFSISAGGRLILASFSFLFLFCMGAGGYEKPACPLFFLFPFLCLYMYVCVSRKQSDKRHPDLTDGALRPVFLALLPEPVTPAALLWGGRQSRPQPILIPEETQ